jgi:hypothetical protein
VAEWLDLTVNLGKVEAAAARVTELEHREMNGSAGSRVRAAKEGLWVLQHRHHLAWSSGRVALEVILRARDGEAYRTPRALSDYHPTPAGTTLTAVRDLAQAAGLNATIVSRARPDAPVVVPSVVHLRSGHFTAVIGAADGGYLIRDPALGGELWVTREALWEEAPVMRWSWGPASLPDGARPPPPRASRPSAIACRAGRVRMRTSALTVGVEEEAGWPSTPSTPSRRA